MKYALVMVWLVNGQVQGRIVQEFVEITPQGQPISPQGQARYQCERELRGTKSMACVPIEIGRPQ